MLISKVHLGWDIKLVLPVEDQITTDYLFVSFCFLFFSAFVFGKEERKINLVVEKFNMVLDAVILLLL